MPYQPILPPHQNLRSILISMRVVAIMLLSYPAMAMPAPCMVFHALIMERAEGPFFLTGPIIMSKSLTDPRIIPKKRFPFLYGFIQTRLNPRYYCQPIRRGVTGWRLMTVTISGGLSTLIGLERSQYPFSMRVFHCASGTR